jgi:hypothetical protein
MIRLRLRPSHLHVVPAVLACTVVAAFVDVGRVFGMPNGIALVVYVGQCLVAIAVFYGVLLFNFVDLTRTYVGKGRQPESLVRLLAKVRSPLAYFVFAARIGILSAYEAASVLLLTGLDLPRTAFGFWLLGLAIVIGCTHVVFERRNLGKNAWIVDMPE